jgi:hypothetical protein
MSTSPEYLHMYFSFDNAIKFLKSLRLKLSSPIDFDDPFEFLPQLKDTSKLVLGTHQNTKEVKLNSLIEPLIFYSVNKFGN